MAETTEISWTDATFNPWIGCTKVSPGCDNCYAAAQDKFRSWTPEGWGGPRKRTSADTWGKPTQWNKQAFAQCGECGWRGELRHASRNDEPGQEGDWCPRCLMTHVKPARRRVFCASLADVFDNDVPVAWRADLLDLIAETPNLDWLLLTKRIGNAGRMIREALIELGNGTEDLLPSWPWPNVWLGATIVNQEEADRDIPKLLATPAAVRFLSMEPLLGDVRLGSFLERSPSAAFAAGRVSNDMPAWTRIGSTAIDWVIVGGESGPGARPMSIQWARSLRDQCAAAGVPFHFKQWGEWAPAGGRPSETPGKFAFGDYEHDQARFVQVDRYPRVFTSFGARSIVERIGKKAAGRLLDGVTHDAFPEVP